MLNEELKLLRCLSLSLIDAFDGIDKRLKDIKESFDLVGKFMQENTKTISFLADKIKSQKFKSHEEMLEDIKDD